MVLRALPDSDSNKRPEYEMDAGHDLVLDHR
jgi:hypothetical protein